MSTLIAAYTYYRVDYTRFFRTFFQSGYYLYLRSVDAVSEYIHRTFIAEISMDSLAYLERNASESDGQASVENAQEASLMNYTGTGGGSDKGPKKKSFRARMNSRRAKVTAGVAAGGATIAIVGAIAAAPGFIMSQVSSLLMDKVGEVQTNQTTTFRRSKYSRFTDVFSADGRRGGAVIKEMEKFGYRFEYDGVEKTKIAKITNAGVEVDPADFDKEISEFLEKRYSLFGISTRSGKWKTKRMEAFYTRFKVTRSSPIVKAPGDLEDPEAEFNKRSFNAIDGNDELEARVRAQGVEPVRENFATDAEFEAAQRNYADVQNQVNADGGSAFADTKEQLANGASVDELDGIGAQLDSVEDGYGKGLTEAISAPGIAEQGFAAAKGIAVVTDVFDKMCSTNDSLSTAVKTARLITSVKLMRATLAFVAADDGQRKSEASADMVKQLMKRVALTDKTMGSFANSQGYKATVNKGFNRAVNEDTRAQFAVDGKLTGFWGVVKDKTNIPNPGCPIVQNVGFQVAQVVGIVALTVFTGGTGTAATEGAVQAAKTALVESVKSLLTKKVLAQVLVGVAIDYSFEQILQLSQIYVQKKMDIPFTGQEVGGRHSAILFSGAGVLHKQRNLKSGLIPAEKTEFDSAVLKFKKEDVERQKQRSFADRIFNLQDTDSLASRGFSQIAFQAINPAQAIDTGTSNVASIPSLFTTALATPFTFVSESAYAQETAGEYDSTEINGTEYATDPYGNIQTIMPDWLMAYSDPKIAAENTKFLLDNGHIDPTTLEPSSDAFKNHVTNCIDTPDTIGSLEGADSSDVAKDCMATQSLTKRFRGHLANLDVDDYVDAELFPEEISSGGAGTSGSGTTGVSISDFTGPIIPCQGQPLPVAQIGNKADWSGITPTGVIGKNSANQDINVYVRDACAGQTNVRTIVIGASIHGTENGGQLIAHELLFNKTLPPDVRVIVIPEINKAGLSGNSSRPRLNKNGVNLNRNFDYNWQSAKGTDIDVPGGFDYKGTGPASEPETQAVQNFLKALGKTNLVVSYHDNLNWAAPSGPDTSISRPIATKYSELTDLPFLNNNRGFGFFEAWYNHATGTPALLVELNGSSQKQYIQKHADAIVKMAVDNVIK